VKRPPGRQRHGSTPLPPLPLPEWDFRNCPVAELSLCRGYEYPRSSKLIRETVARLRAGQDDALTRAVPFTLPIQLGRLIEKFRWWPQSPYLAIPEAARTKLISAFVRPEPRESTENLANLIDPFADDHLHISGTIIQVYLPPGQSVKILEHAFGDLVQRDYPHLFEERPDRVAAFDADQIRDALKFLSMWRLLNHGYTAKQAIVLAKEHQVETYDTIRGYRGAVAKAERKIITLERLLRLLTKGQRG